MDKSRSDNTGHWCSRTGRKQYRERRLGRVPKRLLFLILASAAASISLLVMEHCSQAPHLNLSSSSKPDPMSGVASVVDGDTIEIHGQRIRFNGIDAPESKQYCSDAKGFAYPCGRRSAEALDAFLAASGPVECWFVGWDRYHRFVGDCRRADGVSVASWMVEHGQALDWPRYSHGAYSEQQTKAEASKVGMWVGAFQAPWEWRLEHTDNSPTPNQPPLGIISRRVVAQSGYSCEPRRYCSQISSCDESQWYLHNCSWGRKLDRDGDGVACETLC